MDISFYTKEIYITDFVGERLEFDIQILKRSLKIMFYNFNIIVFIRDFISKLSKEILKEIFLEIKKLIRLESDEHFELNIVF
ncbi:MAG: hypothetical protein WCJ45_05295 [bacterium]